MGITSLLSACMIVKNEERFISGCLESIRRHVDQIVIGDTGSDDKTMEIAKNFGVELYHIGWLGSFSEARNIILRKASNPWILTIDADERLISFDRKRISDVLEDPDVCAIKSLLVPIKDWTPQYALRLFRNDERIYYSNIFHESLLPSLKILMNRTGMTISEGDFIIDHVGYDGDQEHKHVRNIPLLTKQLSIDPTSIYNLHHLGNTYYKTGDTGKAVSLWKEGINLTGKKENPGVLDACCFIAFIRHMQENGKSVRDIIDRAIEIFPGHPDLLWLNSNELVKERKYTEAMKYLQQLIKIGEKEDYDRHASYYSKIFDEYAFNMLALCFMNIGQFDEGLYWYNRALELNPECKEYLIKRKFCELQLNKEN